jgi:hypothetical protein
MVPGAETNFKVPDLAGTGGDYFTRRFGINVIPSGFYRNGNKHFYNNIMPSALCSNT